MRQPRIPVGLVITLALLSLLPSLVFAETLEVTVVDARDRSPIAGAFVMVGSGRGVPFPGNTATTQSSGTVFFQHPNLVGPQTVCAGADSFAYTAVIESAESSLTLPLYRMIADTLLHGPAARLTGLAPGIDVVQNDGNIDAGVVAPTISIDAVLGSGQIGFYAPPEIVELPLIGPTILPGNIVLPFQTEFLFFNFEKETYTIDLPAQTTQTMFVVAARVPIDGLLGNPDIPDLINLAQVRKVGVERDVAVGNGMNLDIDVDIDLVQQLTVFVNEAPNGSEITALSLGSLTNPQGEERFLGYDAKMELADVHDGIVLASTDPQGDLDDVQNLVGGIVSDSSAYLEWATGQLDRTPFTLPAERVLSHFYDPPEVGQEGVRFTWDDVADPGTEPEPTWTLSMIRLVPTDPADTTVVQLLLWEVLAPADLHEFSLPSLPADAPGPQGGLVDVDTTPDADRLVLDVNITNPTGTLDEILISPSREATHFSRRTIELQIRPSDVPTIPRRNDLRLEVLRNPTAGPVRFRLVGEDARSASISVLDLQGRLIRSFEPDGSSPLRLWDRQDHAGRLVPAGVYFIRASTGDQRITTKVLLLR